VDQSAGLVMVDGRAGGFQPWIDEFAPELSDSRVELMTKLRRLDSLGLAPAFSWYPMRGSNRDSIEGFPAETADVVLDPGFFARMFGALIEASDTDDISERQMDMRQLGNVPLIVIRHGRQGMWGLAADKERAAETRWQELQAQLVQKSTDAKLEIAEKSGHAIPLEQPEIIVDAIKELVTKWRAKVGAN